MKVDKNFGFYLAQCACLGARSQLSLKIVLSLITIKIVHSHFPRFGKILLWLPD